jgi:hypothetical protein
MVLPISSLHNNLDQYELAYSFYFPMAGNSDCLERPSYHNYLLITLTDFCFGPKLWPFLVKTYVTMST